MVVPPDLDRLRKELSDCRDGDCLTCDTARFLLSLVDEGGRLVVEQPCEHGFVGSHWQDDPKPDDPKNQFHCPGGSRRVVWPEGEE